MMTVFSFSNLLSLLLILTGILFFSLRRPRGSFTVGTIGFAICLVATGLARFLLSQSLDQGLSTALEIVLFFVYGYLAVFLFLLTLEYLNLGRRALIWNYFLLAVIPLVIIITTLPETSAAQAGGWESLVLPPGFTSGAPTQLIALFSLGLMTSTLVLVVVKIRQDLRSNRIKFLTVLAIAIVVAGAVMLINIGDPSISLDHQSNLIVICYLLIGGTLVFFRQGNFLVHPISKVELFDSFTDGIILINSKDLILDMNPAAETLFGIPTSRVQGNPVEKILENWKNIAGATETREVEFRGSITLNKQRRYLSVRTSRLDDRCRVIILRDITDRRDTHEARQHAREEMFNLLRSIFKSANTSQSSNDLFRDVLFQIAYTFRADSGVICLVETTDDAARFKYTLMARQGSLVKDNDSLANLYSALEASGWSNEHQEPRIIPDASRSEYFARLVPLPGNLCLAILPLLHYDQLMGILVLARSVETGFQSDEIVRLGVVTEELASFIYSDRKRKSDIALAERHRLSQDLHDSITQKLVGLLQLTEALKLGVESGATVDAKRIDRISEGARQALREMRLFLFELAPVDIEKDGLVSILQSRLALVEGRSDIQARMLADSDIVLTTLEETELYYIVEEALNNILKHANAKTVSIQLKQRPDSVFLEIVDNGSGFSLENVKEGSRGLGNIKERARRINGNLNITSTPGQGTRITLVVPK